MACRLPVDWQLQQRQVLVSGMPCLSTNRRNRPDGTRPNDVLAIHLLATVDDGTPVATAPAAGRHIGRMAVLKNWRGQVRHRDAAGIDRIARQKRSGQRLPVRPMPCRRVLCAYGFQLAKAICSTMPGSSIAE